MLVTFEWSDWRNKIIWWIHRLYVIPSWRKKGIFKKMLENINAIGIKKDIFTLRMYVHKSNKSAFQIYDKVGFQETPFTIMQFGSKPL